MTRVIHIQIKKSKVNDSNEHYLSNVNRYFIKCFSQFKFSLYWWTLDLKLIY